MLYQWLLKITDQASGPMAKVAASAGVVEKAMVGVDGKMRDAQGRFVKMSGGLFSMQTAFSGWGSIVAGMAKDAAFAALDMGIAFEASMSKVQALTGASGAEFTQLRSFAEQMGEQTKFSASQAAEAMGFLGMAGFKTNDIMAALPATMDLAASTGIDLGRAADIASNALSAYGLEAKQLSGVVDLLAKTTVFSNTNMEQLAEAFKYAAPVAKSVGIKIEELSAAIGILGNAGIQGSLAGTGLQTAFSRLLKPSDEARAVMRKLGLSVLDTQGNMLPLVNIIQQLERSGAKTADVLEIFGIEAGGKMAVLLGQGSGALAKYTAQLADSKGTAERLAKTMSDNLQGSIDGAKSRFEGLAITIFDKLNPAIRSTVDALGGMASYAKESMDGISALAIGVAAGVAGWAAYSAFTAIAAAATGGLSIATAALNAVMAVNPAILAGIAIGALVAALIYAYHKFDWFRNMVDAVGQGLKDLAEGFGQLFDYVSKINIGEILSSGFREAALSLGIVIEKTQEATKAIDKMAGTSFFADLTQKTFGAGPLALATGADFTGGGGSSAPPLGQTPSEVRSGMSDITGGGPQQKVFNISIAKFQDSVNFVTTTVSEGMDQSQAMFEEMLLRVLNGIQAKQ